MKILIALFLTLVALSTSLPCSVAIVGTDLSGIYTAYRLSTAKDSDIDPSEICLFGETDTYGGRIISVDDFDGGLIEMGLEDYDPIRMPLFDDLVKSLGLKTECLYKKEGEKEIILEVPTNEVVTTIEVPTNEVVTTFEVAEPAEPTSEVVTTIEVPTNEVVTTFEVVEPTSEGATGEYNTVETIGGQKRQNWFSQRQAPPEQQPTQQYTVTNVAPQGATGTETAGEDQFAEDLCEMQEVAFRFFRNRLILEKKSEATTGNESGSSPQNTATSGASSKEEFPFQSTVPHEDLKDVAKSAFEAVYTDMKLDDSFTSLGAEEKHRKISEMTQNIRNEEHLYEGIPVNELDVRFVVNKVLNMTDEDINAAIALSNNSVRLRRILNMNFEVFAVNWLRYRISDGQYRKIVGDAGMRAVIDAMITEITSKGVQIFMNTQLKSVVVLDDGLILLKFENFERFLPVDRLFLSFNKLNLLRRSNLIEELNPEVKEALGGLVSIKYTKVALFYEESWWKNYDLSGYSLTDGVFEKISYRTFQCSEGQTCPGWIIAESFSPHLALDIVNPLNNATVITEYMLEDISNETAVREANVSSGVQAEVARDNIVLNYLHNRIMAAHAKIPDFSKTDISPTFAYVANWESDGLYDFGTIMNPTRIRSRDFIEMMIQPIENADIHFINSDFSHSWDHLESSIVNVERVLSSVYTLEPPEWFRADIYDTSIEF